MQSSVLRTLVVFVAMSGLAVNVCGQQPVVISYFPTHLAPGQTNVLHVASPGQNPLESIEIAPAAGISVTGMKRRANYIGGSWYEFTIIVAKDAAPGPRMLVGVQPTGRTAPVTLTIPNHVPTISGLRILSAQMNQPAVDMQFAADQGATFGETPYVWFVAHCAPREAQVGVVRGKLANGAIRVSIPNPRTTAGRIGAQDGPNSCDLEVRASDSSGTDSNTLKTTVDFK